jgi:hypothetical protein
MVMVGFDEGYEQSRTYHVVGSSASFIACRTALMLPSDKSTDMKARVVNPM